MVSGQLIIGDYVIDLQESPEYSLNESIADIREPSDRQQSYSKTFRVPGTGNNAQAFGYVFDIHSDGNFNPKLKRDARLVVDDELIMAGFAQLKNIVVLDGVPMYDVVLMSELATLYAELGQTYLHELDLSAYDHAYTSANQVTSWTATQGVGYYYPMIDFGKSSSRLTWEVTDLYPAVYVRQYIDKIFALAGKTFTSSFFDSAIFKSLIIPFNRNRLELTAEQILDRTAQASRETTNQTVTPSNTTTVTTIVFNDDSTSPNHDAGANYNTGTGEFTIANDGYYTVSALIYMSVEYAVTSPTGGHTYLPTHDVFARPRIYKNGVLYIDNQYLVIRETTAFAATGSTADNPTYPDADYSSAAPSNPPNARRVEAVNVWFDAGDVVTIRVQQFTQQDPATPVSATPTFYDVADNSLHAGTYLLKFLTESKLRVLSSNVGLEVGDTVIMAQAIPLNIKCTDFFTSIIRLFNLHFQQDRTSPDNYIIEPFDSFYINDVNDWTLKLDNDSDIDITPVGALDTGGFKFTYKPDSDYLNSKYTEIWGEVYGQHEVDADTDFYKTVKTTEVIFSPTPLSDQDTGEMPMPTIYKVDNSGVIQPYGGNIRILIAGGLKDCPTPYDHAGTTRVQYPYAGHLDDPYNPTVDLNFGVVRQVYYRDTFNAIVWNYDNLYNVYYSKYISEIIDADSKIVAAWFNLTKVIEGEIDFRKRYYFKDSYFRLQKVMNRNPTMPSLTRCEFLKLATGTQFTHADTTVTGSYTDGGGNVLTPALPNNLSRDDNSVNQYAERRGVDVNGDGNYVARNCLNVTVLGDDNIVNEGCERISISGSNNNIAPGVTDVVLVNCNNVDVTESGTTYYANKLISGEGSVEVITASTKTIDEFKFAYHFDASGRAISVTLPLVSNESLIGNSTYCKKIDGTANAITFTPNGGKTIDGAESVSLTTQWEGITIYLGEDFNWYTGV